MGSKTPVSILQEYLISKKLLPTYELIQSGEGTHNPEFVYRVYASGKFEDGKGKSKQEAKHRAAEKMLSTLNIKVSSNKEEILYGEDFDSDVNENYVGMLKEYCLLKPYPEPTYSLEEEGGPPHCKLFKIRCNVSQLKEFGISKTKKAAKHIAACKMLKHLKNISTDPSSLPTPPSIFKIPSKPLSSEEIAEKYYSKKDLPAPVKDRNILYNDQQKAFIGLEENSETLLNVKKNYISITIDNSEQLLTDIVKELGLSLKISQTPTIEENISLTYLQISGDSDIPTIATYGTNLSNAAIKILNTLITLCTE